MLLLSRYNIFKTITTAKHLNKLPQDLPSHRRLDNGLPTDSADEPKIRGSCKLTWPRKRQFWVDACSGDDRAYSQGTAARSGSLGGIRCRRRQNNQVAYRQSNYGLRCSRTLRDRLVVIPAYRAFVHVPLNSTHSPIESTQKKMVAAQGLEPRTLGL